MKNGAFAGSTVQHKWWQLPLLLPLTALALFVVHLLKLLTLQHEMIALLTIIVVYGAMGFWLWKNVRATARQAATYPIEEAHEVIWMYTFDKVGNTCIRCLDETGNEVAAPCSEVDQDVQYVFKEIDLPHTIEAIEEELLQEYQHLMDTR